MGPTPANAVGPLHRETLASGIHQLGFHVLCPAFRVLPPLALSPSMGGGHRIEGQLPSQ